VGAELLSRARHCSAHAFPLTPKHVCAVKARGSRTAFAPFTSKHVRTAVVGDAVKASRQSVGAELLSRARRCDFARQALRSRPFPPLRRKLSSPAVGDPVCGQNCFRAPISRFYFALKAMRSRPFPAVRRKLSSPAVGDRVCGQGVGAALLSRARHSSAGAFPLTTKHARAVKAKRSSRTAFAPVTSKHVRTAVVGDAVQASRQSVGAELLSRARRCDFARQALRSRPFPPHHCCW
jgi:hypothetical protein